VEKLPFAVGLQSENIAFKLAKRTENKQKQV